MPKASDKAKVPAKIAKLVTTDEVLLAECDEAAVRYKEAWYDFARALHAVRMKQAYHARGYTSFREYVQASFPFKIRKAELQVRVVNAFRDAGVDPREVDKSKAYVLSRVLTRRNAKELVEFQKVATLEQVSNKVAEIAGSTQTFHFDFVFKDKEDFAFAEKVMAEAMKREATLSRTIALIAVLDHYWSDHSEGAGLEDPKREYPMSDPVSEAVIARDGRCMNDGCNDGRPNRTRLERHSITKRHSSALPIHCTTLCHDCHVAVTEKKAKTTLVNPKSMPGVIRYEEV
jgi:hypothetical protein